MLSAPLLCLVKKQTNKKKKKKKPGQRERQREKEEVKMRKYERGLVGILHQLSTNMQQREVMGASDYNNFFTVLHRYQKH